MSKNDTSEYSELVAALAKPGGSIIADLTPESAHILHMAVGISGEVAELFEIFCKAGPRDDEHIAEELGDIEFYMEGLSQAIAVNPVPDFPADPGFLSLAGVVIQSGNLLDAAKRVAIYNDLTKLDLLAGILTDFQKELLSVYAYLGVSPTTIKEANTRKLRTRYTAGTYSNLAANVRADKEVK